MEMRLYVNPQWGIIVQSFHGELTLENWKTAMEKVWNHPEYSRDFIGVMDARDCDIKFKPSELYDVISMLKENNEERTIRAKGALMVREPMAAALATIYADKMKDFHRAEVFVSDSTAKRYLEIDFPVFEKLHSEEAETYQL